MATAIDFQFVREEVARIYGAKGNVSVAPNVSGGDFLDITDPHVGGSFVSGGYNVTISSICRSPLVGRMAWSGNSNGYIDTMINLGPNLIGQTVTFRFRMVTDEAVSEPGVHIDNLVFTGT